VPKAFGAKYHYRDHDSIRVIVAPPIQNQWYTVLDAHDVRLLWCVTYQNNDDLAAKDIEVRWTIDGNVYLGTVSLPNITYRYWFRYWPLSAGGTGGLLSTLGDINPAYYVDKRGIDFKIEFRMTSVPGTNQSMRIIVTYETLELT